MLAAGLGFVAGVALQLQQPALWPLAVYLAIAGAGAGVGWACVRHGAGRWLWRWRWLGVFVGALLLAAGWVGVRAAWYQQGQLPAVFDNRDVVLRGHVSGLPRWLSNGVQFELDVDAAQADGRPLDLTGKVLLTWNQPRGADAGQPPVLHSGEHWQLTARLRQPHGLMNPHGFDAELWAWEQGIRANGLVRTGKQYVQPQRLQGDAWSPVAAWRERVRQSIFQRVADPRAAGVLAALVMGDQGSIDSVDWDVFRLTGVAHLVSISGLHVTSFAWLAMLLVGWCWRWLGAFWPGLLWRVHRPLAALWGGVALATAYAVFAGWGVPAQRTVVMLAAVTVLRTWGHRWPWPAVWLTAMAVVLAWDPWALLQAGFWLSFVAVGVLFAAGGHAVLAGEGWQQRLWAQWRGQLRTQVVVTVALAPLTLLLFGQVSLAGLLANAWAIPWVTLLVTPLALLGVLWGACWQAAAWAVQAMMAVLEIMSAWPWAAFERPALPAWLGLLAVVGGAWSVCPWPWRLRAWGLLLFWPALAYVPARPAPGQFELLAPDIGQGSAVVIRTEQHTLLYDTGPVTAGGRSAAQRVLQPLWRAQKERLDAVVISHNDNDHSGGMADVLRQFPRAEVWASFEAQAMARHLPHRCEAGQHWEWDGVVFDMLSPYAGDYGQGLSDNAMSCVLRVAAQGGQGPSALLTGDIGVKEEKRLVVELADVHADVLMAAHHGSKTSSSEVWLDAVRPAWVLIQSGYRNRYGHPAPQVLERIRTRGVPWTTSPDCGAAFWRSSEPGTVQCHRREQQRYWHTTTSVSAGASLSTVNETDDQAPGLAR